MLIEPAASDIRSGRLPTGTVTFLFTDVEGSTRLLQRLGLEYASVQGTHARILREAIGASGGVEVSAAGDGFFAVFEHPSDALTAAATAQRSLASNVWPAGVDLRVRMGIHTGDGTQSDGDYVGIDVNRAARIAAAANGGQILLSVVARALVQSSLPPDITLRDLGEHRLKDLIEPEHLYDAIIGGLPSNFPAVRSLGRDNLPTPVTSFVGREREIGEVIALLATARLVTLTGPGGTGKTRLSLEVAHRTSGRYSAGAHFVDLSPVATADLVPSAIAVALGVSEDPARSIADSVGGFLRDREILLVIDNFEHVLEAAGVVATILAAAPLTRVLVTSRAPLGVYGEHDYSVLPLEVPTVRTGGGDAGLTRYAAVALFVERAQAARAGFQLTDENGAAVAAICARVDGLPLAIELAASRVKLLSPAAILARLDRSLELLTSGAATLPDRQRTLRGAIEWSYDLLDNPERLLLARLAPFAGGASLDAIDAVTNPGRELGVDTLDGVASLVDKSLLQRGELSDGEPRFTLFETIREFAAERLDASPDAASIRRRHAEHFRDFALQAEPRLIADDQAPWLERVQLEHPNLRAALRWATDDARDAALAQITASALWRFWQQRGHLSEARRWLTGALALGESATEIRFAAHTAAGGIAYWQSDADAADAHYQVALDAARELGDRKLELSALYNLAFIPGMRNDYESAFERFDATHRLAVDTGDDAMAAEADSGMGWYYMLVGHYDDSIRTAERALRYFREAGNRFQIPNQLATLGQAYRLRGDFDTARAIYLDALVLLGEAKDQPMTGRIVYMLAATASAEGRHEDAMQIWGAADTIRETSGGIGPLEALRVPDAVAAARAAIGDEAAERALAEGRRLGPAAVIRRERARDSVDPSRPK